jgi:spore germination protein KB
MRIERISSRQFTWIIITVITSTSTVVVPGIIIFSARQNAWLSVLLGTLLGLVGLMINLSLVKRFPRQTIAQFAQTLLGPWLGKAIGLFYGLISLFLVALWIRVVAQIIQLSILQTTPLWPLVLGISLASVYGAWLGIEPISRANDLLLPTILLAAVILFLLAFPDGKLYRALSVLQFDFAGIVTATIPLIGCIGEAYVILILAPTLNKQDELKSASLKGILLSGLILALTAHGILFVLGVYRASAYLFPALRVVGEFHFLDVFERLEPLALTLWFLMNCTKMGVLTYCFTVSTNQSLGLKKYWPALVVALIVIPLVSLFPKNLAELFTTWIDLVGFKIIIPTAFFIMPGLLLLIAKVKKQDG